MDDDRPLFITFKPLAEDSTSRARAAPTRTPSQPQGTEQSPGHHSRHDRVPPGFLSPPPGQCQPEVVALRARTRLWFEQTQAQSLGCQGELPEWFHGFISRREAEELLWDQPLGCFLVRFSESTVGFVLSYRGADRCRHFVLEQLPGGRCAILGQGSAHAGLAELLRHHGTAPVPPYRELLSVPLPCQRKPEPRGRAQPPAGGDAARSPESRAAGKVPELSPGCPECPGAQGGSATQAPGAPPSLPAKTSARGTARGVPSPSSSAPDPAGARLSKEPEPPEGKYQQLLCFHIYAEPREEMEPSPSSCCELQEPFPEGPIPKEPLPGCPIPRGPLPEGPIPRGPLPEGPIPKGPIPRGQFPEGPIPKGPFPEGPIPKGPFPEGPIPRGPLPEGPIPRRQFPEGPIPRGQFPGGPIPKGPLPEGPTHEGPIPRGQFPEGPIPKEPLPGCPIPRGPLPEGPIPKGPFPEGPIPKGPFPESPIPRGQFPEGPIPKEPLPGCPIPRGPLPEGPTPEGPTPEGPIPFYAMARGWSPRAGTEENIYSEVAPSRQDEPAGLAAVPQNSFSTLPPKARPQRRLFRSVSNQDCRRRQLPAAASRDWKDTGAAGGTQVALNPSLELDDPVYSWSTAREQQATGTAENVYEQLPGHCP